MRIAAILVFCVLSPLSAQKFEHVFLYDVSGSMRDTLGAPGSPERKDLSEGLYSAPNILKDGAATVVYSFSVPGREKHEYEGGFSKDRMRNLFENEILVTGRDTDLPHAIGLVTSGQSSSSGGPVRIGWVLTDNANDPAGKGPDVETTRAFYSAMFAANSPIQRLYFFPIARHKLVLYVLVCGSDEKLSGLDIERFEKDLAEFGERIAAPRIRVKPIAGSEPLAIDPKEITFTGGDSSSAQLIGSGSHSELLVRGLSEGKPLAGIFRLRLRSLFGEWKVGASKVELTRIEELASGDFPNIQGKMSATLTPDGISVDPQSPTSIVYTLELGQLSSPDAPKAPFFALAAFNPDARGFITGRLVFNVRNPSLQLKIFHDDEATKAVQSVFHLQDIEYFVPKSAADRELRLDFSQPLKFELSYDYLTRWLVLLGSAGTVLATLLFVRSGSKSVTYRLDGPFEHTFALAGADVYPVTAQGTLLGHIRRNWLGRVVCRPAPGVQLNGSYSAMTLRNGDTLNFVSGSVYSDYRFEVQRVSKSQWHGNPGSGI